MMFTPQAYASLEEAQKSPIYGARSNTHTEDDFDIFGYISSTGQAILCSYENGPELSVENDDFYAVAVCVL